MVFTFSGVVLGLMFWNFVLLAVGGCCFWPRLIGTYVNCGLAVLNIAAAITAIVSNTKPASIVCSFNIAVNDFKGDGEFKESGTMYADDYTIIWVIAVW